MKSVIQAFNDWLAIHQQWILIAAFTTSLIESFAIIGVIVPGVALLFGIALAAASNGMAIGPLLIATFAGAVVGDATSFFIGRHFHEKLRQFPPFTSHPTWIAKGEGFFHKFGAISIVAGRFIGPLRPIIPLIAGMFQMSPIKFISINFISAVAWAPTYIVPGFLVGLSFDDDYGLQQQHTVFILGLFLLIGICNRILIKANSSVISSQRPQTMSGLLALSCIALFIILSILVKTGVMTGIDQWIHQQFMTLRHPWLDPIFIAITELGGSKPIILCGFLIIAFFISQRCWPTATCGTAIFLSSPVILGLKWFFDVARPVSVVSPPSSLSFPSGHTTLAALLAGFIVLALMRQISTKHQSKVTLFFAAFVSIIAVSSLYLGVHWFSDVIGGILLAGIILGSIQFYYSQKEERRIPSHKAILGVVIAILISAGLLVPPHLSESYLKFQPLESAPLHSNQLITN
ncbi:MAG: bifunctional DedA family/phosphatase PAP2 family protein [Pseudomonadales bacterium]|nr:bifunctional DedA family/phosphatase PAP2 family protein [Pseudomonadales bacterium]